MLFEDLNWRNGMLLNAEHLKKIKDVNFYKLFYLLILKDKFLFGVINLFYNATMIYEGIIKVNKCLVVMQDGSIIDYNGEEYDIGINLSEKKIDNNEEFIIYISSICNDSIQQSTRTYNINNDYENEYMQKEKIEISKIKASLVLDYECNANMNALPIFKVQKINNKYVLKNFQYLMFTVDHNSEFGKQIINLMEYIIIKSYDIIEKIKLYYKEKYIDYNLFHFIRSYDCLMYEIHGLRQKLCTNNLSMYCIHNYLITILHKCCVLNNQNIIEIQKFSIFSLYESFKYLHDNIEMSINSIFQSSVDFIAMKQYNNIFTAYHNGNLFENKSYIYLQCHYDNNSNLDEIKNEINNMLIASESKIEYIKNARITGLKRKIIQDFETIKNITGLFKISNSIIISLYINDELFQYDDKIVIVTNSDMLANKINFNIVCVKSN